MSILIDENTRTLIQGITGKEGQRAVQNMKAYGSVVSAGVTPGKGGQDVDGVPVYDNVSEAVAKHPEINTSLLYVPPKAVKSAVMEAIDNGIKLINVITERVPIKDSAYLYHYSRKHDARVIGPSSVGIISPGKAKLGCVGTGTKDEVFTRGNAGVISKSGGMCSETSLILTQAGIGQSTVIGIGGDVIACSTFTDLLELFEADDETKAVVLFGEQGGTYEEQVAELVKAGKFTKPIVAFISGRFAESIPGGLALGHAGAIIEGDKGKATTKIKVLKEAGITVANFHHEIPSLVKELI